MYGIDQAWRIGSNLRIGGIGNDLSLVQMEKKCEETKRSILTLYMLLVRLVGLVMLLRSKIHGNVHVQKMPIGNRIRLGLRIWWRCMLHKALFDVVRSRCQDMTAGFQAVSSKSFVHMG
jgi:hypothetical protein